MVTSNVGGVLKTLNTICTNVNGVLRELHTIHTNVSGTLKQIHTSKLQTLTGTASCNGQTYKSIATNVSIPATCTVTFNATIAETPNLGKGARVFRAINSAGEATDFLVEAEEATSMTATAVLPVGVYTFQMLVFNVRGGQSGVSYGYPTVTYTITFS